jgi:acyl-CoA reductase-like NAD-dependent aldehyde dehydrogenase
MDNIISLIVAEAGAIAPLARAGQFNVPMKHFRYAMESALQHKNSMAQPEITPNAQGGRTLGTAAVVREPVGVVAAITPYNYPFMLNLVKVAPALLTGNSVVLKPSPYTPFEALLLGDAARAAGLPEGVLNIVTGSKEAGHRLTTDPRVDLITFTGSDVVGAAIMVQAGQSLKRVIMELGGKSAMIGLTRIWSVRLQAA